ncbi:MAG: hypothetical protein Q9163_000338 [Psora crenata]
MRLYAFGSNSSGQLSIGHRDDTSTPQKCQMLVKERCDFHDMPQRIVAGGNTASLLMESGLVYRAGITYSKQAEHPYKCPPVSQEFCKTPLTETCKAKLCSATWDASIVVTREDEVYVCGRGPKGELGLGSNIVAADDDVRIDHFPPKGTTIVDVASGVSHTVTVLSDGEVYGWGNGRKGQLGQPAEVLWSPRKVEGLDFKVKRAVCGREFTFLVSHPRDGQHAILGSDKWGVRSQAPGHVHDWRDIGASWGSIFTLDKDGKVRSWGRNDRSQLASMHLPPVERLAVGSEHVVALAADGVVLCWGWGEHGNCGEDADGDGKTDGSLNCIEMPRGDGLAEVLGVGAGCATSFFWTG